MFLLVSVRHVGAHPAEHQHGVSIQISTSLGKTFLRVSRIRNIPLTCTSFHFKDSGRYLLNGFDFYFDLFWMGWHWKPAIDLPEWGRKFSDFWVKSGFKMGEDARSKEYQKVVFLLIRSIVVVFSVFVAFNLSLVFIDFIFSLRNHKY